MYRRTAVSVRNAQLFGLWVTNECLHIRREPAERAGTKVGANREDAQLHPHAAGPAHQLVSTGLCCCGLQGDERHALLSLLLCKQPRRPSNVHSCIISSVNNAHVLQKTSSSFNRTKASAPVAEFAHFLFK